MRIALISLLVFSTVAAFAQDDAVVFYAPFDGDFEPTLAGGSTEVTVEGAPRFVEGRVGKAVVVSNSNWLSYPLAGNLNPSQGAIEFWLQPIDWKGTDNTYSHFFVGAFGGDRIFIYKFARWRHFTFHVATDDADHYESLQAGIYPWQPGEWHHAVVTWDCAYLRIYLDGELKTEASIPSPIDDLGDTIYIGKELATPQFAAGETAIDELRIYSRPLFPEEVRRAYQRADNPSVTRQPYQDLLIYYTGFPSRYRAELQFVSSVHVPQGGSAMLSISDPVTGATPVEQALAVTAMGTLAKCEIDTSNFTPARYRVTVRIEGPDGRELLRQSRLLWIRDRFWRRAPQGLPTAVPEPWTPVEVEGSAVRIWNREYRLEGGRISAMSTAGEQILKRPAGLIAEDKLEVVRDWTLVAHTPLQAIFKCQVRVGDATITQKATVEFDGFIRLDATIPPGTHLDQLRLEIPVRREIARYRRTASQREKYYVSGELQPGAWPAAEVFDFWMGDEDRGVDVIYEGCLGWPTERDETQIELVVGENEAVFVAHVARTPAVLTAPLNLSFGIQATPVRPLPEHWRTEWRLSPRVGEMPDPEIAEEYGAGYAVIWWSQRPDTPRWFAFPEPTDPDAFRAMVDDYHARGIKVVVYSNLTNLSPNVPEAIEYSGEWFHQPTPALLPNPAEPPPPERWLHVNLTNPDWIDFIVGWQARVIDEYGVDGWYFDCAVPYAYNGLHPVFDYREACKRAYVAVHERKHDGGIITHMSGDYVAAFLAFTDAMLQGEQYRWPLPRWRVENDYTQVLKLDYARTELTGRNLGVVPVFLPEFPGGAARARNRRNTEHLLAVTRLHDIIVWPIWCDPEPVRELWVAQDERFGIGLPDVEFLPYWKRPPATTDAEEVLVSSYRRPGRGLLVVSNFLGHEDRTVTVRPDAAVLGLKPPFTATDLLSGETIAVGTETFRLDLPEGRARYVVLTEE